MIRDKRYALARGNDVPLAGGPCAVDGVGGARDIAGVVGSEERHDGGDLGRLTEPARPDGIKTGEFRELVRELHTEPQTRRPVQAEPEPRPEPVRDPAADARPEDVVMPPDDASRRRGASKSRNRRRGRPR